MPGHPAAAPRRLRSWSYRHRQRNLAERLGGDPDICGDRLPIAMPKQLGQHVWPSAQVNLAGGVGMAQHMAAKIARLDPGRFGMLDDDVAYRGRCVEWREGHLELHENMTGWRLCWAAVAQVVGKRFGDSRQERQRERDTRLGTQDAECAGGPVDIPELQARDLAPV